MKPPGPSTCTPSAAWADHTPGPRSLLAILLLGFFVLGTANPVHDRPADGQRLEQSPSEGLCPAGHYLSEESGSCRRCTSGIDYISSANNLSSCFPCRVCKEDKTIKSQCTITRNTECQCKPGTFEDKDSTEICQTCSNCTDGEDEVTLCTPETNRKCVPKNTGKSPISLVLLIVVTVGPVLLLLAVLLGAWWTGAWRPVLHFMKRRCRGCEQDPESSNTVRLSLLSLQTSSKTNDSHHKEPDETQTLPIGRKLLVPANGTDPTAGLKMIFEYCSKEVPFKSWDRFMRQMGLENNQIQAIRAETRDSYDILYQMLLKWLHETGLSASINHLLDALEAIGERCALEKIEDYAVKSGKFVCQNTTAQAGLVTQETEPGGSL